MAKVLSLGSLIFLLCVLTALLLDGASAARIANGIKGGFVPVRMAEAENGNNSMVEGLNSTQVETEMNGGEQNKMEIMDNGRELYNIDYHGPTTHPPATPETPRKSPHGSGHRN